MRIFYLLLACLLPNLLVCQTSKLWIKQIHSPRTQFRISTTASDLYSLDFLALQKELNNVPNEFQRNLIPTSISLPLANGDFEEFDVVQTNSIAPQLQKKYPKINNYLIQSKANPSIYGRIDITYQGFHAIIKDNESTTYIDPAFDNNLNFYLVYDRKNAVRDESFKCHFDENHTPEQVNVNQRLSDNNFRTYRMALSCTGEYAQFHGGTVENVLSAMNTTINRINFVYEHQFAVRFEIIHNTDTLIHLDPISDPYDNDDVNMQINQNQIECDTKIGTENYDIGHIFSTGGGGLAGYAVVCNKDRKAWGGTGSGSPINDPFDIDYVAHEVGHQLSGSHTQNNACNRDLTASFEPGSASTIMGYAGICPPNVQEHSDAYFHGYSIKEMGKYIVSGLGNSCATKTELPGGIPTIVTSSGDFTIPINTPFELKAHATGDAPLLYRWDQLDSEIAEVQPPKETNTKGPLFRSYFADSSGIRTFPKIEYIVTNTNNVWEVLPGVSREMNFILTVREDKNGGAKHIQKTNHLTVDKSKGPFVVTYPNQEYITWYVGESVTISWDVANTDKGPVNCKSVNILLSVDGGYSYPHLLATTANDGTEEIIVPNIIGDKMRIKVAAADNVFFDISNKNFEIKSGLPPFSILSDSYSSELCNGDSLRFYVYANSIDGIQDTIEVTVENNNPGISVNLSQNIFYDGDSILITIKNINSVTGLKNLLLLFKSDQLSVAKGISFNAYNSPSKPVLFSPVNYAQNIPPNSTLQWNNVSGQEVTYHLEVATDIDFDNIILNIQDLEGIKYYPIEFFQNNAIYYWRVRAKGKCNFSEYSNTGVFHTGNCTQYISQLSNNIPLLSGENRDSIVINNAVFDKIKTLEVFGITGHSNQINRLSAAIKTNEKSSQLWNEQCFGNKDFALQFSDNYIVTEIQCDSSTNTFGQPGIKTKPVQSFVKFVGSNANNTYTLALNNSDSITSGFLSNWGITLCGNIPVCAPLRIPTTSKLYSANTSCTDNEGWTHYSISADKNPVGNFELMVASLRMNEFDIVNPEDVKINIPSSARFTKINNAEYIQDPTNWTVLNRFWLINPAVQPSGPVEMRFYLTDIEISSLLDAAKLSNETDSLKVFSIYSHGILNPNPTNKHIGIKETDVKLHPAKLGEYNLNKYLEFTLSYLADGCIGAGGQFKVPSSRKQLSLDQIQFNPNPANSTLFTKGITKPTKLLIYHITGKLVTTLNLLNDGQIDISELPSGTYIIKYNINSTQYQTKISIIH